MKLVTTNKKAFFDYHFTETMEAGIVLSGDEIKSIRSGNISLAGSFAVFHSGELFLMNMHISAYKMAYQKNDDESATRSRKLLLHRRELSKLAGMISKKGVTLVPSKLYFNNKNILKVEIAICVHKKMADKRESIRERDLKREESRKNKRF